jgi:hypothetical protein
MRSVSAKMRRIATCVFEKIAVSKAAMKRPTQVNVGTASIAERSGLEIGFSITNQRGEHFCCRAKGVRLRISRGEVQLVEGKRGCFLWFDGCRIELRDGHQKLLYRLIAGFASSDATGLTVVAEVAGGIGGTVKKERAHGRLAGGPTSNGATNSKPPRNSAVGKAA